MDGKSFNSNLPCERGTLSRGIQEGDEAAEMAELDGKCEFILVGCLLKVKTIFLDIPYTKRKDCSHIDICRQSKL